MGGMNFFRILADLSHITAKCILLFSIHRNKSSEGVSMIFQVLYALVFCTRYTDLFHTRSRWNRFFKVFYILSSFYTIGIMRFAYPRTREKEVAWKLGALILGGSLILSPFVMLIFEAKDDWSWFIWGWSFSQILESVCVLPQLLLLRQTTVPTVINSLYIVFLGAYRALYIVNWTIREVDMHDFNPKATSVIFGIIQTLLYIDFAWVYWTRQRVKLRNGGVIDADDLRRGWLLTRIFGHKQFDIQPDEEDEESAPALGGNGNGNARRNGGGARAKWGARGISVSADEGVLDTERARLADEEDEEEHGVTDGPVDPDAKMQDPDELAKALDDDDDAPLSGGHGRSNGEASGVRGGEEWRS